MTKSLKRHLIIKTEDYVFFSLKNSFVRKYDHDFDGVHEIVDTVRRDCWFDIYEVSYNFKIEFIRND